MAQGRHSVYRGSVGARPLALAAICASALALTATHAQAAIPQGNVLLNPGGESGPAATDGISHICPQGWTCSPVPFDQTTLVRYGTTTFPGGAESARIGGGNNFFAGGPSNNLSGAEQNVPLGIQPEFSAGAVKVTFGGCLGGFQDQNDLARVLLTFRTDDDPDGTVPSHTVSLNGPTAAQRANRTTFLPVFQTVAVPPTTRSIRFTVSFQRAAIGYNDGYGDNLSVEFGPAASSNPPAPSCSVDVGGGGPGSGPGGPGTGPGGPGTGPGSGGGPGGGGKPLELLGFGAAVVGKDGKVRVRVTCNSTQVSRCKGTLSASLARASTSAKRKPKPKIGTARYSVRSLKTRTIAITLRPSDARKIREASNRALSRLRLRVRATTKVRVVKFRQTELLKVKRRG
jgi:hypothetical protein